MNKRKRQKEEDLRKNKIKKIEEEGKRQDEEYWTNKCTFFIDSQFCTYDECMKKGNLSKIMDHIGKGTFGSVYQVCRDKECDYVMKLIMIEVGDTETIEYTSKENFMKEIDVTTKASDYGISPKAYSWWICPVYSKQYREEVQGGFIVMDKWDMTLRDFIRNYKEQYYKQRNDIMKLYESKVKKWLKDVGIIHGDVRDDNIVIRVNRQNKVLDIALIDWGFFSRQLQMNKLTKKDSKDMDYMIHYIRQELTVDKVEEAEKERKKMGIWFEYKDNEDQILFDANKTKTYGDIKRLILSGSEGLYLGLPPNTKKIRLSVDKIELNDNDEIDLNFLNKKVIVVK